MKTGTMLINYQLLTKWYDGFFKSKILRVWAFFQYRTAFFFFHGKMTRFFLFGMPAPGEHVKMSCWWVTSLLGSDERFTGARFTEVVFILGMIPLRFIKGYRPCRRPPREETANLSSQEGT